MEQALEPRIVESARELFAAWHAEAAREHIWYAKLTRPGATDTFTTSRGLLRAGRTLLARTLHNADGERAYVLNTSPLEPSRLHGFLEAARASIPSGAFVVEIPVEPSARDNVSSTLRKIRTNIEELLLNDQPGAIVRERLSNAEALATFLGKAGHFGDLRKPNAREKTLERWLRRGSATKHDTAIRGMTESDFFARFAAADDYEP